MPRRDLIQPFRVCFLFSYANSGPERADSCALRALLKLCFCNKVYFPEHLWRGKIHVCTNWGKRQPRHLYDITQVKGQVYSSSLTDALYSGEWGRRIALSFRTTGATQWVPRWPGLSCAVCLKKQKQTNKKWWRVNRREVKMSDCRPAASRKGPCPCHCPELCL